MPRVLAACIMGLLLAGCLDAQPTPPPLEPDRDELAGQEAPSEGPRVLHRAEASKCTASMTGFVSEREPPDLPPGYQALFVAGAYIPLFYVISCERLVVDNTTALDDVLFGVTMVDVANDRPDLQQLPGAMLYGAEIFAAQPGVAGLFEDAGFRVINITYAQEPGPVPDSFHEVLAGNGLTYEVDIEPRGPFMARDDRSSEVKLLQEQPDSTSYLVYRSELEKSEVSRGSVGTFDGGYLSKMATAGQLPGGSDFATGVFSLEFGIIEGASGRDLRGS